MDQDFYNAGLNLEEAFFRKHDAELIAQQRKLESMKRTRQAIAEVSGISNEKILDRLMQLDIAPEILSSLAVIPLVEVAWADGRVDDQERREVLHAVENSGISRDSIDHALLEAWLKHRPSPKLLEAWVHYVRGLCESLTFQERAAMRTDLLGRARKVAECTGGVLGIGKVSVDEAEMLRKMERAFD